MVKVNPLQGRRFTHHQRSGDVPSYKNHTVKKKRQPATTGLACTIWVRYMP
jgi:hypothetical protein